MGKKKKKKKKHQKYSLLSDIDKSLFSQYDDILEDLDLYQYQIYLADEKARKKNKKKMKKKTNEFYDVNGSIKARKKVVQDMEEKDYFNRFSNILKDIGPIVTIIGRLVAALIMAILSIDSVKRVIKPDTMEKMNTVFSLAMSL